MKMTKGNMRKVKQMLINKDTEQEILAQCNITSKDLIDLLFNKEFHRI